MRSRPRPAQPGRTSTIRSALRLRIAFRAEFDKIIPLIEEGAAMGIAIPTVHDRIEQFVGV